MPRQARLDSAGALHHIMARGLDRSPLFEDDKDRKTFIERLGMLVSDDKALVYAWVLLDNHTHLLFKSGVKGISHVMRKLLTWYLGVNASSITRAIERVNAQRRERGSGSWGRS